MHPENSRRSRTEREEKNTHTQTRGGADLLCLILPHCPQVLLEIFICVSATRTKIWWTQRVSVPLPLVTFDPISSCSIFTHGRFREVGNTPLQGALTRAALVCRSARVFLCLYLLCTPVVGAAPSQRCQAAVSLSHSTEGGARPLKSRPRMKAL